MIRCIRIWTGEDGESRFKEGSSPCLRASGAMSLAARPRWSRSPSGRRSPAALCMASRADEAVRPHPARHPRLPDEKRCAFHDPPRRHPDRRGHHRLRPFLAPRRRRARVPGLRDPRPWCRGRAALHPRRPVSPRSAAMNRAGFAGGLSVSQRDRAPSHDAGDRPGLGWQRDVAGPCRHDPVRRIPWSTPCCSRPSTCRCC
jgi:hypothetical protein